MIWGDFLLRSGDREKSSKSGVSRRNRESWQVWMRHGIIMGHGVIEVMRHDAMVSFSDLRLFPYGPDSPHSVLVQVDEDLKTELWEGSLRRHG